MNIYFIKVLLLIGLFAALCVKGGQICSADGVMAMTRLVEPARITPVAPPEPRSVEEDFRGISPRPDLSERITPSKRVVKAPVRLGPSTKAASSLPAKDSTSRKQNRKG